MLNFFVSIQRLFGELTYAYWNAIGDAINCVIFKYIGGY